MLIVNQKDLGSWETAVLERLHRDLGYEVDTKLVSEIPEDLEAALVVVCCDHVPREIRNLGKPVVVCRSEALFDLGMTKARKGVDFGARGYSSVSINEMHPRHPLTAGLSDRHQVTQEKHEKKPKGWAKPGERARIAATMGGDSRRAVIFGYEKGEQMPCLDAPHRRAAFLVTGDAEGKLTQNGWFLFDAAIQWATGTVTGSMHGQEDTDGHWYILPDGSPTRVMSAPEYREWVHDKVKQGVLKTIGRIIFGTMAAIGITGIAAYFTLFLSHVHDRVKDETEEAAKQIDAKIDEKISKEAAHQVATLVLKNTPAFKKLKEELGEDAKTLLNEELKKPGTRERLVNAA